MSTYDAKCEACAHTSRECKTLAEGYETCCECAELSFGELCELCLARVEWAPGEE